MMIRTKSIVRRTEGSTAVEFAIAAPVVIGMILGLIQLGVMFLADAGLKHAIDEGARLATIYPMPSTEAIEARVDASKFGLKQSRVTGPSVTYGTVDSTHYVEVTMSYAMPVDFVFFKRPDKIVTKTRRAYLTEAPCSPPTSPPRRGCPA